MPLVGRGSKLLAVKGDLDFGQHVRRGAAVKPCYAAACDDEHEQHNKEQPLEHAEHTAPEGLRDRILRLVVLVVGGAVMLRCLGRRGRPGRRRGVLLQPGHDLRNRKLRRAGDVRHACGLSGKGFIVGKVIAENKAGRLGSVLRGDVPGLLRRVGDGCVCRGGLGGASAAGVSSAAGRPLSVRAPSRRARPFPQARAAPGYSGRRARWVRQRPPGRGVSGGSGLLSDLGSASSGAAEQGLSCAGALRSLGLVSRGFFVVLAAFGVLGFTVLLFCCLCVFGPRLLGDAAGFSWSARLRRAARRYPSAQGRDRRQAGGWLPCGAGASAWGLLRLYRSGFLIFFHTHTHSFRDLYGCPAKRQRHGRPGVPWQLFYSASRNCRPLFPSSAVCGSVDLLPMRSS